jgi:CRP/FNR family transcriptional regulator, cyclic AMP receptor protein
MSVTSSPRHSELPLERKNKNAFNVHAFLKPMGVKKRIREYHKSEIIYLQGDAATTVFYIHDGGVKLSVVNEVGREAVVAVLGSGDLLGEGSIIGQPIRAGTATAITTTSLLVIKTREMIRRLHTDREFSDRFITYVLTRNIRTEETLIDQLFNCSEKRLARTLLLLAHYGEQDRPPQLLPDVSQEMLAEMVGTTRSRINFFMNKFRKQGFIYYSDGLHINASLLSVVLHE